MVNVLTRDHQQIQNVLVKLIPMLNQKQIESQMYQSYTQAYICPSCSRFYVHGCINHMQRMILSYIGNHGEQKIVQNRKRARKINQKQRRNGKYLIRTSETVFLPDLREREKDKQLEREKIAYICFPTLIIASSILLRG